MSLTEIKAARPAERKGTPLPWSKNAKLVQSEETQQFVCDLNDDKTRANWLAWGKQNGTI